MSPRMSYSLCSHMLDLYVEVMPMCFLRVGIDWVVRDLPRGSLSLS